MAEKRVAITGSQGFIADTAFMNTTEFMRRMGNNTGNLVFQHAASRLIADKVAVVGQDIPWDAKAVREQCSAIVVPSANFIRENFDLTGMVKFFEDANLPITFLGLGAQADNFEHREFDLHPSIMRLIDLIRERSPLVSLRGEFTRQVLERFNVQNVEITGCPSNFITQREDLPDIIEKCAQREMHSFITHADEPWPKNPKKSVVERRLAGWTADGPSMMVQQSVPVIMEYLREDHGFFTSDVPDARREAYRRALFPDGTMQTFREFIASKLRVYVSVDQWMEDSAKYDFSVGLRLHGNMAAWQAGVPSLWIHHDSRTRELAETMAVPHIALEDFVENCETVQQARDRWDFDKEAYRSRRAKLLQGLNRVLKSVDVDSSFELPVT